MKEGGNSSAIAAVYNRIEVLRGSTIRTDHIGLKRIRRYIGIRTRIVIKNS